MEGEEYLGASALHLAIAYSNNELVNDLIDAGADVHQRATGRFFLPKDQQSNNPVKNTDYEGLAYFGEAHVLRNSRNIFNKVSMFEKLILLFFISIALPRRISSGMGSLRQQRVGL